MKNKFDFAKQFNTKDYSKLLNEIVIWILITVTLTGFLIFVFSIDKPSQTLKCFDTYKNQCTGNPK